MGGKLRDKTADKLRDKPKKGGHSIAEHLENMGDKAKNKRKTNPARRTQQSSQGRHAEKETLKTPTVNCLGKNDFGRLGSCCSF